MEDKMKVHYSSKTVEWATPQELFDKYNQVWGFTTDVCATSANAKCTSFFTKEDDGLSMDWVGVCWMNPPYGRVISEWMEKAYSSCVENGATVVCLVPSRTDTRWFHNYAVKGDIEFIKGRVKFGGKGPAPFPSMVVVFRPATVRA